MKEMNMSRRELLGNMGKAGVILTVPAFLEHCSSGGGRLSGDIQDPIQNARALKLETPILTAINCGITAPNPHNTQAWKFLIQGPEQMLLFVDEKRTLLSTDPTTRQIHIGQGCFLEHLSLGARKLGYKTDIKYFPQGKYDIKNTGRKPVASVRLIKDASLKSDPLYDNIKLRSTNRTDYNGPDITPAEFKKAMALTAPQASELEFISTPAKRAKFTDLFYKAMAREMEVVERADESRIWFRLSDDNIYKKRDGISLRGAGMSGFKLWLVRSFFISLDKKSFHSKQSQEAFLGPFKETLKSSKAYVFFRTKANQPKDWVKVGRDYARFQLALTSLGLVMAPLSQILQEYPEMKEYKTAFEKATGTQGAAKIQMAVRVGRSDYNFMSPRRSPRDMLVKS